jgi:hypothetical protein
MNLDPHMPPSYNKLQEAISDCRAHFYGRMRFVSRLGDTLKAAALVALVGFVLMRFITGELATIIWLLPALGLAALWVYIHFVVMVQLSQKRNLWELAIRLHLTDLPKRAAIWSKDNRPDLWQELDSTLQELATEVSAAYFEHNGKLELLPDLNDEYMQKLLKVLDKFQVLLFVLFKAMVAYDEKKNARKSA